MYGNNTNNTLSINTTSDGNNTPCNTCSNNSSISGNKPTRPTKQPTKRPPTGASKHPSASHTGSILNGLFSSGFGIAEIAIVLVIITVCLIVIAIASYAISKLRKV